MNTSEVIRKLQALEKTIPFDAEVVIGDDWQPSSLVKIFHQPPYTFLEFKGSGERFKLNSQENILMSSFISSVLQRYAEGDLPLDHATAVIAELVSVSQDSCASEIISHIKTACE
ncbi:hypothetical protein [Deefgea rivuli]|uniref:hypothetical protein n=1 Tax=Deefgea rivuli TaxID=400948 RepID=UPI00055ABF96|nr:hypothetical protein [Deefgea rivuli]